MRPIRRERGKIRRIMRREVRTMEVGTHKRGTNGVRKGVEARTWRRTEYREGKEWRAGQGAVRMDLRNLKER